MKKTLGVVVGLPAAAVMAWFMAMDIKNNSNLDPIDFELSKRVCENVTITETNNFISYMDYLVDNKTMDTIRMVAKEQCKASIDNSVESMELSLAGKMFSDGFSYEEKRAIREAKQLAKDNAAKFGAMGKNAVRIWAENNSK